VMTMVTVMLAVMVTAMVMMMMMMLMLMMIMMLILWQGIQPTRHLIRAALHRDRDRHKRHNLDLAPGRNAEHDRVHSDRDLDVLGSGFQHQYQHLHQHQHQHSRVEMGLVIPMLEAAAGSYDDAST